MWLFRFCLLRELLEFAADRMRCDRHQKYRRRFTLLAFEHFASIFFRNWGLLLLNLIRSPRRSPPTHIALKARYRWYSHARALFKTCAFYLGSLNDNYKTLLFLEIIVICPWYILIFNSLNNCFEIVKSTKAIWFI